MTDPKPEKRGKGAAFWAVVVLGVLVLYVLSFGPFMSWCHQNGKSELANTYHPVALYSPLAWAYRHSPTPIQEIYASYVHWWSGIAVVVETPEWEQTLR